MEKHNGIRTALSTLLKPVQPCSNLFKPAQTCFILFHSSCESQCSGRARLRHTGRQSRGVMHTNVSRSTGKERHARIRLFRPFSPFSLFSASLFLSLSSPVSLLTPHLSVVYLLSLFSLLYPVSLPCLSLSPPPPFSPFLSLSLLLSLQPVFFVTSQSNLSVALLLALWLTMLQYQSLVMSLRLSISLSLHLSLVCISLPLSRSRSFSMF